MYPVHHTIPQLIGQGHLVSAFGAIRAKITPADAELTYRLDALQETYRQSLNYYLSGAEDPERDKIVSQLRKDLLSVDLELEYRHRLQRGNHLRQYIRSLSPLSILEVLDMIDLGGEGVVDPRLAEGLLEAVWTSRALSEQEVEALLQVEDDYLQSIILSGVLFALDYYPSISHVRYLMRSALRFEHPPLRARAIVGLVLASSYSWMSIWEQELSGELEMILELDASLQGWMASAIKAFYQTQITPSISTIVASGMKKLTEGLFADLRERFSKSLEQRQAPSEEGELSGLELPIPNISSAPEVFRVVQEGFDVSYEGVKRIYQSASHHRSMIHYLAPVSRRDPAFAEISDIAAQEIRVLSMQCDSDAYLLWPMMRGAGGGLPFDLATLQQHLQMFSSGAELPERKPIDYIHSYLRGLYRLLQHAPGRHEMANYFEFDPLALEPVSDPDKEDGERLGRATSSECHMPLLGKYVVRNERLWSEVEHIFGYGDYEAYRERCLRMLISISPAQSDYYDRLAKLLFGRKAWADALTQWSMADLIEGGGKERQYHIALCHHMLGHADRAVSILLDLSTSLTSSEDMATYEKCLLGLASIYQSQERWDEVLKVLDEYELTIGYIMVEEALRRALCLFRLRRYEEAWKIVQGCFAGEDEILCGPEEVVALILAGHISLALKQMEQAMIYYCKAYELDDELVQESWRGELSHLASIPGVKPDIGQAIWEYLNL